MRVPARARRALEFVALEDGCVVDQYAERAERRPCRLGEFDDRRFDRKISLERDGPPSGRGDLVGERCSLRAAFAKVDRDGEPVGRQCAHEGGTQTLCAAGDQCRARKGGGGRHLPDMPACAPRRNSAMPANAGSAATQR